MSSVGYSFHEGSIPLLISLPHDGRMLPEHIGSRMTAAGLALPDTDWHVAQLYEFSKRLGASVLVADYSRYVVDLNRPADDEAMYTGQTSTGLCPLQTFSGENIYLDSAVIDAAEKAERIQRYWRPYHDKIDATLATLRSLHGYALLWDAHSIPSVVPRLFEGELPVLNVGTWDGRSCDQTLAAAVYAVAETSNYAAVLNGRFKGGHITRYFGRPQQATHAIQLEIAQRAYMNEATLDFHATNAAQLASRLEVMLRAFIVAAERLAP